ncbi:hypothetical protein EJ02DRAFT_443186 [Clathrospora elynae]|uniref:Zn(2)-C6 fungal-type domain-containing protein n=1 Tax=Clathrospora elynae TaxID=706981 RepID=A0A6A5T3L8_9PLEO|nr:hypothetical protein EJ02DRAFT_443186 [Clathrospora elynae]
MTSASPVPTSGSRRVPLDKRQRTETSCDKCKSRKQKCRREAGQAACRYCAVNNMACLTTQPRKKRLYGSVESLGERLALLEALVKGLLPEADVTSTGSLRQLAGSLGIALPGAAASDDYGAPHDSTDGEDDDAVSLLPDQQGQVQYIGPGSSFAFHVKLRTLVGRGALREFVLFGCNAGQETQQETAVERAQVADTTHSDAASLALLVRAFFERIHPDFPVLHEPSFREAYAAWRASPRTADPAWLCSFTCVLLLARRVARMPLPADQERVWWQRVQTLLPVVLFTSSITAVQALVLAAVHLHNTNHRDACWNLTGTAIRIAHGIGLHQDTASIAQTLWWTLYALEQLQVSSYDRPSAIEHPAPRTACSIAGGRSDFFAWSTRLLLLLGATCRAPKTIRSNASVESYLGPLSPAAGILRDLGRWKNALPQHLYLDALDTSPPAYHRPLLLLHSLYHYTIIVLCRSALLARASTLTKEGQDSTNSALIAMADACAESGRHLAHTLLRIESLGKFDAVTGCDFWYALAASSVLVLHLVCLNKLGGTDMSEPRTLLSQLADLAQRHRRNPYMPGTIEKFASIIPELHSMADSITSPVRFVDPMVETGGSTPQTSLPPQPPNLDAVPLLYHQSASNSGVYMLAGDAQARIYPDQAYPGPAMHPQARFDRTTQMQFMDFTINNVNNWNWGDIGTLLEPEGVPNTTGLPKGLS